MAVFEIKTYEEIFEDMKAFILAQPNNKITDFRDGSASAVLLGAVAEELEALHSETVVGWKVIATWAMYEIFAAYIGRKGATAASGFIIFGRDTSVPGAARVPASSVITDGITQYITVQDASFSETESTPIPIKALELGEVGNVAANAIKIIQTEITNILYCYNPTATSGGASIESIEMFKRRFSDWMKSLKRSTASTIRAYATMVAGVHSVAVRELFPERGDVTIYVEDGSGSAAAELLDGVKNAIEGDLIEEGGIKPAGIFYLYTTPELLQITVNIELTFLEGASPAEVSQNVETLVTDIINTSTIGIPYIYSEILYNIQSVDGVESVKRLTPSADIDVGEYQIIRLRSITVSSF